MRSFRRRALWVSSAALWILSSCHGGDPSAGDPDEGNDTAAVTVPLTVSVVGPGGAPVTGYRWLLERDLTYRVNPGVPDPATLAVRFHRSHMPVVQAGTSAEQPMIDPAAAYFLSVLPDAGYAMSGAQIAPGQTNVTVVVNPLPLPTAQVTVLVFRDNAPINNAIDLPNEVGLAGFAIQLEDAGGRYGQNGGHQTKDAFDNPLGTTYDANGDVVAMGDGVILTDADGTATIKNLAPGKYGVIAVPPPGSSWVQTSTIEGTKVIDVWVKANEPAYFMELGPPGYHAEIGFVQPMNDPSVLTGGSTISGQVVNLHMSRPPGPFFAGAPLAHTNVWVGLNAGPVGTGTGVFAGKASADGSFSIPNVPPGSYQLVIWDSALDQIFAFHNVTVNPDGSCGAPGASCALGEIPVFQWFTRLEHHVFYDADGDGFRDAGEPGIPEMAINLRWRDGTIYQSFPTDTAGFVPFDQVFPFFAYMIAEVDYTRFKATGVTVTVDDGGPIDPTNPWSFGGQLNPQPQAENNGLPYRTETGPVLLQAFQGFIGQTSVMQWGKRAYPAGENGGISGIVYYATTRAENDPRYAAAETWEPGIANVTVNLWDATGTILLQTVETDSWDDSQPTGCQGPPFAYRGVATDCFDGLKNFNQVRPGVFDGGYAFTSYFPGGVGSGDEVQGLPPGKYIVEVVPPPGYEIVKEEDKNVDFGDTYTPTPQLLPPPCVGPAHTVPNQYSLFPLLDDNNQPVSPFRAGLETPLCTRKLVTLNDRQNAAADFFLFTYVPIASHVIGFVLDDVANEFDRNSPTFGEKYAPPWMPISVRDWTGREIAHTYTDELGVYNVLIPSTYTVNIPNPSGVSPNMLTFCVNSPTRASPTDPNGFVLDPHYNPQYSQFCYTAQFMPGTTTYLDTPVVPQAAFAGPDKFPLDCELVTGTPRVFSVDGPQGGPFVSAANSTQTLTITSLAAAQNGLVEVLNPAYDGTNARTILRDFGFGATPGTVRLGTVSLPIVSWLPGTIVVTVPTGATTGELAVTRGDTGRSTVNAVTVTVGANQLPIHHLAAGETIQQAIDNATPGTLILVPPGLYDEVLIMWKPVRLQGAGEGTVINAVKAPAEKLAAWRAKVEALITAGSVSLLPSQGVGFGGIEPATLFSEEGPAILVLARNVNPAQGGFGLRFGQPNARIDGFTITGGDGGIIVNGYAHRLQIGNNRIVGNGGAFGGGVRLGHATLVTETNDGLVYQTAFNDRIAIHHSQISRNGGLDGAGGGISLYTGSDRYEVTDNFICGNFTMGDGGGIGHLGFSDLGVIARNTIVFNESFNQGLTVSGGGIALSGAAPLNGGISPGTGGVKVTSNTIRGNAAGAGDGGGILLRRINGADVAAFPNSPNQWSRVDLVNNLITNNVAALAGGGIAVSDAVRVRILHTVVANNDSTATAGDAFAPGSPNQSTPQPAGIVSRAHSPELAAELAGTGEPTFSDPRLVNDIIWHNRSFYFTVDNTVDPPGYALAPLPSAPVFADLAVLGTTGTLDPRQSILTDVTGYHSSNLAIDPQFVAEYFNGARGVTVTEPEPTTAIDVPVAFDEGGNWIRVNFGPLTLADTTTLLPLGNYRIAPGSPATDQGLTLNGPPEVATDIDGQPRPVGDGVDIGAFEIQ